MVHRAEISAILAYFCPNLVVMATALSSLKLQIAYFNSPIPKGCYTRKKLLDIFVQNWNQCNFGLFLPKFGYHGNRPCSRENSHSIFEFADPKRLFFKRKISRYVVQKRNQCNSGLFWPKFGCHGNRPCSPENSDSIFEFGDLKNPVHAKNVLTSCTELKSVHFWPIFA